MGQAGQASNPAAPAALPARDALTGSDLHQDFSPRSPHFRLCGARTEAREVERRVNHDPVVDAAVPVQWRMLYAPPEPDMAAGDTIAREKRVAETDITPAAAPVSGQAQRPVTRDDMLRELGRIADFFRRTEPHSPLAYTLEEAVRRGRLTWPELLSEVVPDDKARGAMLVMLGIRPAPPA